LLLLLLPPLLPLLSLRLLQTPALKCLKYPLGLLSGRTEADANAAEDGAVSVAAAMVEATAVGGGNTVAGVATEEVNDNSAGGMAACTPVDADGLAGEYGGGGADKADVVPDASAVGDAVGTASPK
jgi:hypothetical protein